MSSDDALTNSRMAAWAQGHCQHPACPKPMAPWEVHHVVYEQELRRLGEPKWHPDNVMRLCVRCHKVLHHNRLDPVPYSVLRPHHIEFAKRVLGDYWYDYLARRYPDV